MSNETGSKTANLPAEGNYLGKIKNWYFGVSQSGTGYIEFVVLVESTEDITGKITPLDKPMSKQVVRYLSSGALDITISDLQFLGFTDEDMSRLDRDHPEAHDFMDKAVHLRCSHETFNEKTRDKWNFQRRKAQATKDQKKALTNSLADVFAARMAAKNGKAAPPLESGDGGLVGAGVSASFAEASDIPF